VGDRFRIGDVHLMVIEPCLPCYKLGIPDDYRFGAVVSRISEAETGAQSDVTGIFASVFV
jgi:MOSC domain-containing protein YiiM